MLTYFQILIEFLLNLYFEGPCIIWYRKHLRKHLGGGCEMKILLETSLFLQTYASCNEDISQGALPLEIQVQLVPPSVPCTLGTLQSSQAFYKVY